MVKSNVEPIIEDMDLQTTVKGMIEEGISGGLIEQKGFNDDGEAVFGLTHSGRRMVETSDLGTYIKHRSEMDLDEELANQENADQSTQREDPEKTD